MLAGGFRMNVAVLVFLGAVRVLQLTIIIARRRLKRTALPASGNGERGARQNGDKFQTAAHQIPRFALLRRN